jgi:hypothetical protein
MKIFYKAMVIVGAFLVFVCLLYLGLTKWVIIPEGGLSERGFQEYKRTEHHRQERAIKLVKDRFWDQLKPVIENQQGYVKHIGWKAFKVGGGKDYYEREILSPLAESTYIVSYTYTTLHLIPQNMVEGWWWEVVLGDNTVRSIDATEYLKEMKVFADSIQKKTKFDPLKYGSPEKKDTSK